MLYICTMLRSYKYQLDLNETQKVFFAKSFGSCRYVFNWSLDKRIKAYQTDKTKLSAFDLSKELTGLKKELLWLNEVNSQSLQQSIRNMESAFTKFFRDKKGFPTFKNKFEKQSCKFTASVKIDFVKQKIKLPNIGWIRAFIDRTFEGKIGTVTVSKNKAGKYFVSVLVDNGVELPQKAPILSDTTIGIDVGIKEFAVLSNGEHIANPKFLENSSKRLSVLQRRLSKKQKGSKRRELAKLKVAKYHYKITCQRTDFIHKLTSKIVAENQSIIIEDLSIKGMLANHCLARSIQSASWSEFYRQLEYKSEWYGKNLIRIGRFEPSSKMCSCGTINKELTLKDREWTCKQCGVTHDRDLLAAQNIKKFGLQKQNLIGLTGKGIAIEDVEMLPLGKSVKRQVKTLVTTN